MQDFQHLVPGWSRISACLSRTGTLRASQSHRCVGSACLGLTQSLPGAPNTSAHFRQPHWAKTAGSQLQLSCPGGNQEEGYSEGCSLPKGKTSTSHGVVSHSRVTERVNDLGMVGSFILKLTVCSNSTGTALSSGKFSKRNHFLFSSAQ